MTLDNWKSALIELYPDAEFYGYSQNWAAYTNVTRVNGSCTHRTRVGIWVNELNFTIGDRNERNV